MAPTTSRSRARSPTRSRQADATRGRIIEISRELFAERGYEATSIPAILERAGVARGGLYHHFAGKREIFRAVREQVEAELCAWMQAANNASGGPWVRLRAACMLLLSVISNSS